MTRRLIAVAATALVVLGLFAGGCDKPKGAETPAGQSQEKKAPQGC